MKNFTKSLFSFLALIFGIVAAFMLVLPAMAFPDSDSVFTGYEIVFGTEFANLGGFVTGNIVSSIWGILAYLLPLAAALIAIFVKRGAVFSVILFALSLALFLTLPDYTVTTVTILNNTSEINVEWTIASGLVIASVCSLLGFIVTLFQSVTETRTA